MRHDKIDFTFDRQLSRAAKPSMQSSWKKTGQLGIARSILCTEEAYRQSRLIADEHNITNIVKITVKKRE